MLDDTGLALERYVRIAAVGGFRQQTAEYAVDIDGAEAMLPQERVDVAEELQHLIPADRCIVRAVYAAQMPRTDERVVVPGHDEIGAGMARTRSTVGRTQAKSIVERQLASQQIEGLG